MAIVRFDSILSLAFGSITNAYTSIGSPLANNWRIVKITNNTDGDMMFSANASTDNLFVPAGGFTLYDFSANTPNVGDLDTFVMALGTQFSIKYITAPTTGTVYIEGTYAKGV
jgi:hypothetical protein